MENNNQSSRQRDNTVRYSVSSLFQIIRDQDNEKGDVLAKRQKELYDLKREISQGSKKNYHLEKEITQLDNKIALLIKNRITLEEVLNSSGAIQELEKNRTGALKDRREKTFYGQLFYLLQRDTYYIATTARLVKLGEIDNLLQTVVFTLYGNQYDDEEEHLLLSMFGLVLAQEFEDSTLGNLLRANTALTRMMTTYTRRGQGQTYLKNTLTPILSEIMNDKDLSLEINPQKVYETYINEYESKTGQVCPLPRKATPEEAQARPEIQRLIQPRLKQLDELANKVIDRIINSIDNVPYGCRWICRRIKDLAKEKFPEATKEQVCSLIGGFFLLRFVNPAVVTPQAFMLVDTKMSANTRRNLTLLAKVLQNLANNTKFGGLKEYFMEPLNSFLSTARPKLNQFLDDLTRVDNLDEQLSLDRYLRMGKSGDNNTINITLNEIYFIHGLLVQHQENLKRSSSSNPLHDILKELGPAPPQLPRKDNVNIELPLINRYEGTESTDSHTIKPEQLYHETKYLLFTIIKSLPQQSLEEDMKKDLKKVLTEASKYAMEKKDFKLVEKVKKIIGNIKKLVDDNIISDSDNFAKLRKDTVQELVNYEAQIEKTMNDKSKLTQVLQNIHEHNEFLKQQHDFYKQYLNNVRPKCSTNSKEKSSKDKKGPVVKKGKGPVKYSHSQLQKDCVIIESDVPEERRKDFYFSFSAGTQGFFIVSVSYKGREISEMKLQLDDLLERQHNNNLEMEVEFLKLNVNMLIFLLNKTFMG